MKRIKSVKPSERGAFNIINTVVMCVVMVITVYPIWFAVINSLNYGDELVKGYSFLWPAKFTLASWSTVLGDSDILQALWITASRTVIVTVGSTNYVHVCVRFFQTVSDREEILHGAWICEHVFQRRNHPVFPAVQLAGTV